MVRTDKVNYYFLNETTVDPELAMSKRKILSENVVNTVGPNKLFTITFVQVLQSFGVRNWNGRVYNENVVMKALDSNPLIQNDIQCHAWCGEYGHPLIEKGMNELARQMTIFPPNACWTINKYWKEGNLLMGECTTLSGGYGDMMRDRILTGLPAQASSRAIGGVDKSGNALPGLYVITYDGVIRCSHKEAMMRKDTARINEFPIQTSMANTMSESCVVCDITKDRSFTDFIMSESTTKQQISMLCDTLHLDYDSMTITENAIKFMTLDREDPTSRTTITIPLNQLVGAEYYNLF